MKLVYVSPVVFFLLIISALNVYSDNLDSLKVWKTDTLDEVEIVSYRAHVRQEVQEVQEMTILSGKKVELINVQSSGSNLVQNSARQIFARSAGINIWENDGSGVQIGVASRGLSPNRSWEFNVRQNGYDVSADPMGYPEAYYNPATEGVQQIQLIRGAASLQYGPQFGGLLNYQMKKGPSDRKISIESNQSIGSYGLFNSFNALGGQLGRWNYYVFYHYRQADGWRDNAEYSAGQLYGRIGYAAGEKLNIGLEITHTHNQLQQPGGLNDSMFKSDPSASVRARNWMTTPWNIAALSVDYRISEQVKLNWKTTGLLGDRKSVGFTSAITTPDKISTSTGTYAARQVDTEQYVSFGSELRMLADYSLFDSRHTLAAGLRYFSGTTERNQKGVGTDGTDADFSVTSPDGSFPRVLEYGNVNMAAFAENIFRLSPAWTVTPGIRLEHIRSTADGRLGVNADGTDQAINVNDRTRNFLLVGVGTEYRITSSTILYANIAQSYRPVTFSELTPPATTDVIDPDLKDSKGYSADLGYKGRVKEWLSFDFGVFYMYYNDRIGTITLQNEKDVSYQYRTNLGTSIHKGAEAYAEVFPFRSWCPRPLVCNLSVWASFAYTDARYHDYSYTISNGSGGLKTVDLSGKKVEYAPEVITRFGVSWYHKGCAVSIQGSHTDDSYSDASNTEIPSSNGQTGIIPSYTVFDATAQCMLRKHYFIKGAVSNLTDVHYFTRRAGGYPGPGILPNEGRTFILTLGVKF